jgi:hypothetical protein
VSLSVNMWETDAEHAASDTGCRSSTRLWNLPSCFKGGLLIPDKTAVSLSLSLAISSFQLVCSQVFVNVNDHLTITPGQGELESFFFQPCAFLCKAPHPQSHVLKNRMPPIRNNEVIDLSSSSPIALSPSISRIRTRSRSSARSKTPSFPTATGSNTRADNTNAQKPDKVRAKASDKGKQPLRQLCPVIELSDSEDETRDGPNEIINQASSSRELAVEVGSDGGSTLQQQAHASAGDVPLSPRPDSEVKAGDLPLFLPSSPIAEKEHENEGVPEAGGSRNIGENLGFGNKPFLQAGHEAENEAGPIAGPSQSAPPVVAPAPFPVPPPFVTPNSDPAPTPALPIDPSTQTEIRILEIIPDIDPSFLRPLIATHLPTFSEDPVRLTEYVLGVIFERGNDVPRIKGKGKRKSEIGMGADGVKENEGDEEGRQGKKAKVDWASKDRPWRGGQHYFDLALVSLHP